MFVGFIRTSHIQKKPRWMETPDTNKISKIRIKKKRACLFEADFFFLHVFVSKLRRKANKFLTAHQKKKKAHDFAATNRAIG